MALLAGRSARGYYRRVLRPPAPPYALATTAFRFPALAALAGRLPLGSGREAVLAALIAARLAAGATPPSPLDRTRRTARAVAAQQWLHATCPDPRVRAACSALADATAGNVGDSVAQALQRVMEVTAPHLDQGARSEILAIIRVFAD